MPRRISSRVARTGRSSAPIKSERYSCRLISSGDAVRTQVSPLTFTGRRQFDRAQSTGSLATRDGSSISSVTVARNSIPYSPASRASSPALGEDDGSDEGSLVFMGLHIGFPLPILD